MSKPIISVVLPCYYRFWHFIRAVEYNPLFQDDRVEIVLCLDEPSQSHLFLEWAKFNADRIKSRVLVYSQAHDWRCPCIPINVGIRRSLGQYCIVQSPETIVLYPFRDYLFKTLSIEEKRHGRFCLTGRKSTVEPHELHGMDNLNDLYEWALGMGETYKRYGFILFRRKDAIQIGGYDETRKTYGYEDTQFRNRLIEFGAEELTKSSIRIVHVNHPAPRLPIGTWQSPDYDSVVLINAKKMGCAPFEKIYDWA
jgi:hypothetical protein